MTHSVDVTLLGRTLSIRTQDNPDQVLAAAKLVQDKLDELHQMGSAVASDRLLALVALNLAGETLTKQGTQNEGADTLLSALDDVVSQAEGLAKAPLR